MAQSAQPHRRLDVTLVVIAAVLVSIMFVLLQVNDLSSNEFLAGMLIIVLVTSGIRLALVLRSNGRED